MKTVQQRILADDLPPLYFGKLALLSLGVRRHRVAG